VDAKYLRNAEKRGAIVSRESDGPRLSLPRACRLVRRAEYDAVYREGRRRANRDFTAFLRPNNLDLSRFGWSIKKGLGNAVLRNRIRRRLREIVRLHRQEIAPGWDIVIHPRSSAASADFAPMAQELMKLLPRAATVPGASGKPAE
jgi:ribonuclease P protein component